MQFNWFSNCKNSDVKGSIPLNDFFHLLTGDTSISQGVLKARTLPEDDYDWVKIWWFPTITPNFIFDKTRDGQYVIKSTGFIYIEYDWEAISTLPVLQISGFTRSDKIYASFSSFGGKGIATLVRVSGVTVDNFFSTYDSIVKDLGVEKYFDPQSRDIARQMVIPYSPNPFLNESSFMYEGKGVVQSYTYYNTINNINIIYKKECRVLHDTFFKYHNADVYATDPTGFVEYEEKVPVWHTILPDKISKGGKGKKGRNNTLFKYCLRLAKINPTHSPESLINKLHEENKKRCETPLSKSEIVTIVERVLRYEEKERLNPKPNHFKRFGIPKNWGTTKEKTAESNRRGGLRRKRITAQKIHDVIAGWDLTEKITAKSVANKIINEVTGKPMSHDRLKRYWKEFKEFAGLRNQELNLTSWNNSIIIEKIENDKRRKKGARIRTGSPRKNATDSTVGTTTGASESLYQQPSTGSTGIDDVGQIIEKSTDMNLRHEEITLEEIKEIIEPPVITIDVDEVLATILPALDTDPKRGNIYDIYMAKKFIMKKLEEYQPEHITEELIQALYDEEATKFIYQNELEQ